MTGRTIAGLLAAAIVAQPVAAARDARADIAPIAATAPVELTQLQKKKVAFSEKWGRALFNDYEQMGKISNIITDRASATAMNAVTDRCAVRYRALVVIPPHISTDRLAVYYIGDFSTPEGLMIGRHYRIIVSGDGRTAKSVTPSAPDCTFAKPQDVGDGMTGIAITNMEIPVPSDIHVFLSLASGETLFVQTQTGYWQVKSGKIKLLRNN